MSIDLPRGSGYVAMGSSFGAGPGLLPRVEGSLRRAGRSNVNYPHLVAASRGLVLTDVTFSGATTADFLGPSAAGIPAQLAAVEPSTRLVTVTGGGNDIGYIGALTMASVPALIGVLPSTRRAVAAWTDPSTMDSRFDALRVSLTAVVRGVRARAPRAAVVIVDYLTILPPDNALITGRMDPAIANWARGTAHRLSETFRVVADAEQCAFLAVGDASRAHHAWAAEPWTHHFRYSSRGGAPNHPNAAGMRAVAGMLDELLGVQAD